MKSIIRTHLVMLMILSPLTMATVVEADGPTGPLDSLLGEHMSEVASRLSSDDWKGLKKHLEDIRGSEDLSTDCFDDAPLRLLLGHAYLATGENTLAVNSFYCSGDTIGSPELAEWTKFAEILLSKNPESASALYIMGDALARAGRYDDSVKRLDSALKRDPRHTLALNARGVVRWLIFERDSTMTDCEIGSVEDFIAAAGTDTPFADAWANRGLIGLRAGRHIDRAAAMFDEALERDEDFWLAMNGKAIAKGADGEFWKFNTINEILWKNAPDTPYLEANWRSDDVGGDPRSRGAATVTYGISDGFRNMAADLRTHGWQNAIAGGTADYFSEVARMYGNAFDAIGLRGGIYMVLRDGDNLVVNEDGSPRLAGTWFTLNYPAPPLITITEEE